MIFNRSQQYGSLASDDDMDNDYNCDVIPPNQQLANMKQIKNALPSEHIMKTKFKEDSLLKTSTTNQLHTTDRTQNSKTTVIKKEYPHGKFDQARLVLGSISHQF